MPTVYTATSPPANSTQQHEDNSSDLETRSNSSLSEGEEYESDLPQELLVVLEPHRKDVVSELLRRYRQGSHPQVVASNSERKGPAPVPKTLPPAQPLLTKCESN